MQLIGNGLQSIIDAINILIWAIPTISCTGIQRIAPTWHMGRLQ